MPENLVWLAVLLTVLTILATLFEIGEKVEKLIEWFGKRRQKDHKREPLATPLQEDSRLPVVDD